MPRRRLSQLLRGVSPVASLGIGILLCVSLASTLAPLLARLDPTQSSVFFLAQPSSEHWLGTDDLGRDVYARLLFGGRASLIVGIGAATIATLVGAPIGLAAGYVGGRIDMIALQFINIFIALPGLVLAMMITAVVGPSLANLTIVLGLVTWPRVARLVRGQTFAIRESAFVEAAKSAGGGAGWVIVHHILPNATRVIAAQFALSVAYAIFTSASLSFLGMGAPPPTPDWGGMVRGGLDYLAINPMISLAPSVALAITVLGFHCVGSNVK